MLPRGLPEFALGASGRENGPPEARSGSPTLSAKGWR